MVKQTFNFKQQGISGIENLPVSVFEKLKDWNVETSVENGKVVSMTAYAENTIGALKKLKLANFKLAIACGKM